MSAKTDAVFQKFEEVGIIPVVVLKGCGASGQCPDEGRSAGSGGNLPYGSS